MYQPMILRGWRMGRPMQFMGTWAENGIFDIKCRCTIHSCHFIKKAFVTQYYLSNINIYTADGYSSWHGPISLKILHLILCSLLDFSRTHKDLSPTSQRLSKSSYISVLKTLKCSLIGPLSKCFYCKQRQYLLNVSVIFFFQRTKIIL